MVTFAAPYLELVFFAGLAQAHVRLVVSGELRSGSGKAQSGEG